MNTRIASLLDEESPIRHSWALGGKFCRVLSLSCLFFLTSIDSASAQGTLLSESAPKTTLTLAQAVDSALTRNPSLRAVVENAAFAEGELESARERPNPILSTLFSPDTTVSSSQEFFISLDHVWETAGKRKYRTLVAQDHVERAHWKIENAKRLLIRDVKIAFAELLEFQSLQNLSQGYSEFLAQFSEFNQVFVEQGEVSKVNLDRVQLELEQAASERLLYDTQLASSRTRLAQLMGMSPDYPFEVQPRALTTPKELPPLEEMVHSSLQFRPDLKVLQSDLEAARDQLSLEKARSRPNVTLGVDYSKRRDTFEPLPPGTTTALGFHAQVPIPVFDRNHGGIMRALATVSSLQQQLIALRSEIQKEVLVEVQNYTLASATRKLNSKRIPHVQSVADIFSDAYNLGGVGVTDVLDLQRAVFALQKGNTLAEFEQASAGARLEASVGVIQ